MNLLIPPLLLPLLLGELSAASLTPSSVPANSAPQEIGNSTNPARDPNVYIADIDFLLSEFGNKAGNLLRKKGVDWDKVTAQFREEAKAVRSDAAHVKLCERLVARLRDGHAGLMDLKVKMPDESNGRRHSGPQVHLLEISNRVHLRQAFGAAAQKGLRPGMEILRIDRLPARQWLDQRLAQWRDTHSYSTEHQARYAICHWGLGDWEGTAFDLEVLKGAETNSVSLVRQGGANYIPVGPLFPPPLLRRTGRQSYGKTRNGFAYIHLRDIPGNLPEQLDKMLGVLDSAPGLILDMRANGGGGCDHGAVFSRFVPAGGSWRNFSGAGSHPYPGPMVVIVDAGTRSAGETVSGMLKENGRAFLIGDAPTAGTSSSKQTVAVPSGLFSVRFSVASNGRSFNNGQGIEGLGIPPHELVPYAAPDLLKEVDTQIRRAEELLKAGLPSDTVPFGAKEAK